MICISFDSDHMSETRMAEFLELVHFPGEGTFFCTQKYDCLEKTAHESCPHPYLGEEADWTKELEAKRLEFPKALGWRSHSCVFSHILAKWVGQNKYQYVSIHDDFGKVGMQPVRHAWGVWHLPIYYMDTLDLSGQLHWDKNDIHPPFSKVLIKNAVNSEGLYVFDFHPIHLLINTPNPEYYFEVRDRFRAHEPLASLRYTGYGVATYFEELCNLMREQNLNSIQMEKVVGHYSR